MEAAVSYQVVVFPAVSVAGTSDRDLEVEPFVCRLGPSDLPTPTLKNLHLMCNKSVYYIYVSS
jgi:hypothetical protein